MTNPNNAVGTNGAFNGRTSVNAFNDVMAAFGSRGILSGWAISPNSGMTVAIGGSGITRDVAVAEDNAGNKTSVNNISQAPISLTIAGAPVSNSRIDAIVAYVDNPPTGVATVADNYGACGLLDVQGAVAGTPTAPDEATIRTAITADGASGTTAYYVVLGYVTVGTGTTDITADMITAGPYAQIGTNQIGYTTSTVTCTIAGQSTTANKVELGGGIVMISAHRTLTNVTFSASATNVKITGLPSMATALFCNVEAAQIGQAASYVSYPHFNASCTQADLYVRNTAAAVGALEANFIVIGIPA